MSRYFFNFNDRHGASSDPDGHELDDLPAARREAIAGIRSLVSYDVLKGIIDLTGFIEITDSQGELLLTVQFEEAVLRTV